MDKKSVNIPTYIFVLIVLLIAVMVFIFLVHAPFREQRPIYESNHASAVSQISLYNDYLSRADSVQAKIDEMRAEYEERSAKLFVNAKQSPDDIRDMVNGLNYELNNFTIRNLLVFFNENTILTTKLSSVFNHYITNVVIL